MKKQNDIAFTADRINTIRQMCDKLIIECAKEKPNRLTISNILTEKIQGELELAEAVFYGAGVSNDKLNRRISIDVGVMEGKISDSLLENENLRRVPLAYELNVPGEHIALSR